MITIQKIAKGQSDKALVRFTMPEIDGCGCLYLVGWFDEWAERVYRMEPASDGGWSLSLELETGCEYQYCFRTADGRWVSDATLAATALATAVRNSFIIGSDIRV